MRSEPHWYPVQHAVSQGHVEDRSLQRATIDDCIFLEIRFASELRGQHSVPPVLATTQLHVLLQLISRRLRGVSVR
jgi:hypothetical protein